MKTTEQNFKPILFNTAMVQAILADRKLQTRRIKNNNIRLGLPKYRVNDIIWVRETFAEVPVTAYGEKFIYRATFDRTFPGPWKPSLFMPKEAARIFLKVTNVRCERLQDISGVDAFREGSIKSHDPIPVGMSWNETVGEISKIAFQKLWDSINGKKHPWESNPWVWVYDFERIEKPENFI